MKKKVLILALAMCVSLGLAGCTKTETVSVTENGKTTTTTTVTDSKGTTTTTEETTEEETEEVAEEVEVAAEEEVVEEAEYITASITFDNECGVDIYEMYFSDNNDNDWGENIVSEENAPIANGETLTFVDGFTYSEDCLVWDLMAVDVNGDNVSFEGLDFSYASDPYNLVITLKSNVAGEYTATVE